MASPAYNIHLTERLTQKLNESDSTLADSLIARLQITFKQLLDKFGELPAKGDLIDFSEKEAYVVYLRGFIAVEDDYVLNIIVDDAFDTEDVVLDTIVTVKK